MNNDIRFMQRAMELAQRGEGAVGPNPLVGAVIVRNGRIIGAGWHEHWGGLHAERNALARCSEPPTGATLYVTASPCLECSKLIIQSGIRRVIYSENYRLTDGIDLLKRAGVEVVFIELED